MSRQAILNFGFSRRSPRGTFLLAVLGILAGATASPLRGKETGGLQSPFTLGASARALGMGGAVGAVADDAASFLQNPAALAELWKKEFSTFHAGLFEGALYDALAYGHPLPGAGGGGLAAARLAVGDVRRTVDSVRAVGVFETEEWFGAAGYGLPLRGGLSAGLLFQYRRQKIGEFSDSGMGVDAGLLWRFARGGSNLEGFSWRNLSLGLTARNLLSPEIRLAADSDRPSLALQPALAFRLLKGNSALWASLEADWNEKAGASLRAGLEYAWKGRFLVRGGYDGFDPTFGGGVQMRGFQLDYALNHRELGALHRFSLAYRFGRIMDSRRARRLEILRFAAESYQEAGLYDRAREAWRSAAEEFPEEIDVQAKLREVERLEEEERRERNRKVRSHLAEAQRLIDQGDFAGAVEPLTRVLAEDPGHPEAERLFSRVGARAWMERSYLEALEANRREDYPRALKLLEGVMEKDPDYRDAKLLAAEIRTRTAPLESLPPQAASFYAEGVTHYIHGRWAEAAEAWRRVLGIVPGHPLIQRNLAEAEARLQESRSKEKR